MFYLSHGGVRIRQNEALHPFLVENTCQCLRKIITPPKHVLKLFVAEQTLRSSEKGGGHLPDHSRAIGNSL